MKKILVCVMIVATTVGAMASSNPSVGSFDLFVEIDDDMVIKPTYVTTEQLIKSANAGEASCRTYLDLAERYAEGRGVEKNWIEAMEWYRKAHREAMEAKKEIEKKLECESTRANVAESMVRQSYLLRSILAIGDIFAKGGWGVEKDEAKAFEWYHKAAEEGSSDAMLTLGEMYFYGRGVAKEAEEAVKWYHRAAERSNAKAYYRLADCYMHGDGVYEDMVEAMKWRLKWFRECHRDFYFFGTVMLPVGIVLLILVVIAIVKKLLKYCLA